MAIPAEVYFSSKQMEKRRLFHEGGSGQALVRAATRMFGPPRSPKRVLETLRLGFDPVEGIADVAAALDGRRYPKRPLREFVGGMIESMLDEKDAESVVRRVLEALRGRDRAEG